MRVSYLFVMSLGMALLAGSSAAIGQEESIADLLKTIQSVGPKGAGHPAAIKAVKQLREQDSSALVPILEGMEDAEPLAANWLRNAFETIVSHVPAAKQQAAIKAMQGFIDDTSHKPQMRRLAYEALADWDAKLASEMIPGFIDDPSDELRREAVVLLIEQAEQIDLEQNPEEAKQIYTKALASATDEDQVKAIVGPLEELGQKVDLQDHFGFITEWVVIGPFDNTDESGFDVVYPPEKEVDLGGAYAGKNIEATWQPISTEDDYGVINVAKDLGPYKGAIAYLYTEFHAREARDDVEFRLATPNAWKLWVNGEEVFAREEYHRGTFFDQYRLPNQSLKAGKNRILIKLCQNEQEQPWAQDWQLQLRLCEPTGRPIKPVQPPALTQR